MKLFISYSHTEKAVARELAKRLEAQGINTWFDEHELEPPELWEPRIRRALTESDCMVVVFARGQLSPNVLVEIGFALAQRKKIYFVAVGSDTHHPELPELSKLQVIRSKNANQAALEIGQALELE